MTSKVVGYALEFDTMSAVKALSLLQGPSGKWTNDGCHARLVGVGL
jgi:hypothetical protein